MNIDLPVEPRAATALMAARGFRAMIQPGTPFGRRLDGCSDRRLNSLVELRIARGRLLFHSTRLREVPQCRFFLENPTSTQTTSQDGDGRKWWALYTISRREKDLMRRLRSMNVAFYCPLTTKRYRSRSGRALVSHNPLFSGYVFLFGNQEDRYQSLTTNCVSRYVTVPDSERLVTDLRQIQRLINTELPVTPEERLEPGDRVLVKSGAFKGMDGVVIRRGNERRLMIAVNFLQRGASVELEDWELQPLT
jgi:transcription antitermination factor NusG